MLGPEEIRRRLPHADNMCLLENVLAHDKWQIVCSATSHLNPENPLRSQSGLAAIHAIEYAAQAMALHGSLTGSDPEWPVIVSSRDVEMRVVTLQDIVDPILIRAELAMRNSSSAAYWFSVEAGGKLLAKGRLTVAMLDRAAQ